VCRGKGRRDAHTFTDCDCRGCGIARGYIIHARADLVLAVEFGRARRELQERDFVSNLKTFHALLGLDKVDEYPTFQTYRLISIFAERTACNCYKSDRVADSFAR
jgi:hypothetical protein